MTSPCTRSGLGLAGAAGLLLLAACAGPDQARLNAGGPPAQGQPVTVAVALPEYDPARPEALVTAAGLKTYVAANAQDPSLTGQACVGYVSASVGAPEIQGEARDLVSLPIETHRDLADGRAGWSPVAICRGGPALAGVSPTGLSGGQPRLLLCEGITKVALGWRAYCGTRGPGPAASLVEYLITPLDGAPAGRFQVARTCAACVRYS